MNCIKITSSNCYDTVFSRQKFYKRLPANLHEVQPFNFLILASSTNENSCNIPPRNERPIAKIFLSMRWVLGEIQHRLNVNKVKKSPIKVRFLLTIYRIANIDRLNYLFRQTELLNNSNSGIFRLYGNRLDLFLLVTTRGPLHNFIIRKFCLLFFNPFHSLRSLI